MGLLQKRIVFQEQTDWDLVQLCRKGNDEAWSELITRYERLVFYIAHRQYGLTAEDSADIVQITFSIMLRSLKQFHAESNLKSWLITVTKRHVWRMMKRNDKEDVLGAVDLGESALVERSVEAPSDTAQWETAQWINAGLVKLNDRCQKLLTALYLSDIPPVYADIAQNLGMRVGSIGPTRARCLAKLKQHLEND